MDALARYEHWPDPVTIALSTVVAGTALQTAGQLQQGKAAADEAEGQRAIANFNAKVQKQEAQSIRQQTAFRQRRQAQAGARAQSSIRAAVGASGAVLSEGAPLALQAEQAAESELEGLLIGFQGDIEASRAKSQGKIDQLQAGIFGRRAGAARTAGFIGAGSAILSGFKKTLDLPRPKRKT